MRRSRIAAATPTLESATTTVPATTLAHTTKRDGKGHNDTQLRLRTPDTSRVQTNARAHNGVGWVWRLSDLIDAVDDEPWSMACFAPRSDFTHPYDRDSRAFARDLFSVRSGSALDGHDFARKRWRPARAALCASASRIALPQSSCSYAAAMGPMDPLCSPPSRSLSVVGVPARTARQRR